MKTCKHCNIEKTLDSYYKHKGICKECTLSQNKKWKDNNKTKTSDTSKKWYNKTKENRRELKANYYRERRKNDEFFRISSAIRNLIRNSIKRKGFSKTSKSYEILGCSFEEFKIYVESKFESWMNWDNYGKYNGTPNYGWDIDHIEPLSSAKTEESVLQLCNYTNLQPLCSKINRDIKKDLNTHTIMLELSMDF